MQLSQSEVDHMVRFYRLHTTLNARIEGDTIILNSGNQDVVKMDNDNMALNNTLWALATRVEQKQREAVS